MSQGTCDVDKMLSDLVNDGAIHCATVARINNMVTFHFLQGHVNVFHQVTFSEKTRKVAEDLGLVDPAVVQGMYIFKQPRIGTEGKEMMAS